MHDEKINPADQLDPDFLYITPPEEDEEYCVGIRFADGAILHTYCTSLAEWRNYRYPQATGLERDAMNDTYNAYYNEGWYKGYYDQFIVTANSHSDAIAKATEDALTYYKAQGWME